MRFIIRTVTNERYSDRERKTCDYIAWSEIDKCPKLNTFLKQFNKNIFTPVKCREGNLKVFIDDLDIGKHREKIEDKIKKCDIFIPLISNNSLTNENSYTWTVEWMCIEGRLSADEFNNCSTFKLVPIIIDDQHPYAGLFAFREEDRDYFFGREREINALVKLIDKKVLTVLFGKSGVGKTSLLRAGLIPRLRSNYYLPITCLTNEGNRCHRSGKKTGEKDSKRTGSGRGNHQKNPRSQRPRL
jgi:hypothetical protein